MSNKDFLTDEEMAELEKKSPQKDFISDEEMAALEKKSEPMGPVGTFLGTAADEALMGYGPNIYAAGKTLGGTVGDYAKERDIARKELEAGQSAHETASMLGTGAGIIGGGIMTGGLAPELKVMQKAPILGRMVEGAIAANVANIARNIPEEEGKVDPLQIEKRIEVATDPLTAGLSAVIGAGAGAAAGKVAKMARDKEALAGKAMGMTPKQQAVLASAGGKEFFKEKNQLKNLSDFAVSQKIVSPTSTINDVLKNSYDKMKTYGSLIRDFYKKNNLQFKDLNSSNIFDQVDSIRGGLRTLANPESVGEIATSNSVGNNIAATVADYLRLKGKKTTLKSGQWTIDDAERAAMEASQNMHMVGDIDESVIQNLVNTVKSQYQEFPVNLDLKDLWELKKIFQSKVKYVYDNPELNVKSKMFEQAANHFSDLIDQALASGAIAGKTSPDAMAALRNYNRGFSYSAKIADFAETAAMKELNKSGIDASAVAGTIGRGIGTGALVSGITGNPLFSLLAGAGEAAAESYLGPRAAAMSANIGYKTPQALIRGGTTGGSVALQSLLNPLRQEVTLVEQAKILDQQRRQGAPK